MKNKVSIYSSSGFKGKHHSLETKMKISNSLKGRKLKKETILKIINSNKGKHFRIIKEKERRKIRKSLINYYNNGGKSKLSNEMKNYYKTKKGKETLRKMSEAKKGTIGNATGSKRSDKWKKKFSIKMIKLIKEKRKIAYFNRETSLEKVIKNFLKKSKVIYYIFNNKLLSFFYFFLFEF